MKIHTSGKRLNSPTASINYLTFSAEDDDERAILTKLYEAYVAGSLINFLGECVDTERGEPPSTLQTQGVKVGR